MTIDRKTYNRIMWLMVVIMIISVISIALKSRNGKVAGESDDRCNYEGRLIKEGETIKSADGCNSCGCEGGEIVCTLRACE